MDRRPGRAARHRRAGALRLRLLRQLVVIRPLAASHRTGVRPQRGDDRLVDRAQERRSHQPGGHRRLPGHPQDQRRARAAVHQHADARGAARGGRAADAHPRRGERHAVQPGARRRGGGGAGVRRGAGHRLHARLHGVRVV